MRVRASNGSTARWVLAQKVTRILTTTTWLDLKYHCLQRRMHPTGIRPDIAALGLEVPKPPHTRPPSRPAWTCSNPRPSVQKSWPDETAANDPGPTREVRVCQSIDLLIDMQPHVGACRGVIFRDAFLDAVQVIMVVLRAYNTHHAGTALRAAALSARIFAHSSSV